MKKLLVLSVLLGLMALPMFAIDMSFGGDATFGFVSDFSGDVGTYAEKYDWNLDMKGTIDDFNAFAFRLDALESAVGPLAAGQLLEMATVTSDIGKWLGLPIGLKVTWGWDDPNWNQFADITEYGNVTLDLSPTEYWGLDIVASYKMVEFELAFNPGIAAAGDLGYLLAGLALKEPVKGLNAEVYYFQNASAADVFDAGLIAFDAAYAAEFGGFGLTVGPTFSYDLGAETVFWAVGVEGAYDMFTVDLGVWGTDDPFLTNMDFSVLADVIEKLQIYAGVELALDDSVGDTFQGLDVGVNANIGVADLRLGYVVTENSQGEIGGWFTMPADGGLYFLMDVNY